MLRRFNNAPKDTDSYIDPDSAIAKDAPSDTVYFDDGERPIGPNLEGLRQLVRDTREFESQHPYDPSGESDV